MMYYSIGTGFPTITLQDVQKTTDDYIERVVGEVETLYLGKYQTTPYPDFDRLLNIVREQIQNAVTQS